MKKTIDSADKLIIQIGEVADQLIGLDRLSSGHDALSRNGFIDELRLKAETDPYLYRLINFAGATQVRQDAIIFEAIERTQRAICRFSSIADQPEEYFWLAVEKLHGTDQAEALRKEVAAMKAELNSEEQAAA